MDLNLIGCTLGLMSKLFMNVLVDECSCGRLHGKWAIFNGIVDDRVALAEVKSGRASSMATKRQRQEEQERIWKEAHDNPSAKEYAQNMLEWGRMVEIHNENRMVQIHNENIQKSMQNVAAHTRMPAVAVPPPLPPPPLPPTFRVSMSPNQFVKTVGTFHSSIGVETPEETPSRIAVGGFGGPVNATTNCRANRFGGPQCTNGGGNYSPPQDDFLLY